MTVMTIPLDDRGRLNARALVGDRGKLSAMQTDFAERVGKPHGLERGVQGSRATHERVKSAYAHLNDPEHAVELPERRPGNFLGRGKETDAQWRQRASEAATGALVGAWSARRREQREHEVKILSLERQTIGTPAMKHQLERLEREKRVLSRVVEGKTAEIRQLQRDLRHQEIALDVAWEYATRLGKRQGIEEKPLNEIIEKSIKEAIRSDDAELASASKPRAAQKIRATPAPGGLPPTRPRRRAAARPSRVRSAIRSRSNCAIEAKTWNTSRPAGVVVSMSSARDRKPAPAAWMRATIPRRSWRERLRRSYFVTTKMSPGRSWSINRSSSGRAARVPEIFSAKTRPAPAASRAAN